MPNPNDRIVLLLEAADSFEAERLRQILEAEGIGVSVGAASHLPVTGITGPVGIGGTRLMVLESDFERAVEIRDAFAVPDLDQPITESYVSRRTKGLFRGLIEALRDRK